MPVLFSYSHKVYLHQGEYLKQNGECYFNFYNSVADTVCISAYSTSKCEIGNGDIPEKCYRTESKKIASKFGRWLTIFVTLHWKDDI